jgi:hypothetical protein
MHVKMINVQQLHTVQMIKNKHFVQHLKQWHVIVKIIILMSIGEHPIVVLKHVMAIKFMLIVQHHVQQHVKIIDKILQIH